MTRSSGLTQRESARKCRRREGSEQPLEADHMIEPQGAGMTHVAFMSLRIAAKSFSGTTCGLNGANPQSCRMN
jgi:hypothetical protein